MSSIDKLDAIRKTKQRLEKAEQELIMRGLGSNDIDTLIKSHSLVVDKDKAMSAGLLPHLLDDRDDDERKSFMIDPYSFNSSTGFKHKLSNMSYDTLRGMAKTPIINSIIKTRINQVANFSEGQDNKYSLGFVIEKKKSRFDKEKELTTKEKKEIEFITEFMMNCGSKDAYQNDDFDTFLRKYNNDSLCFDQSTIETIYNKKGQPHSFYCPDASTFRITESLDDKDFERSWGRRSVNDFQKVNGYYPSYAQVYNNDVVSLFYPWELNFGVRNPTSDIRSNGYGCSELEDLITIVTSMLWGDEYNRGFFKRGSAPKGVFRVSGNMHPEKLKEFRQYWKATMEGVYNSWRTPFLEADKVDWINMQQSNKDMEYSNWSEYLIKIGCAVYLIDPAEINFPLKGGANESGGLFEGSNEARLKHSKDKGLFPLLKFNERRLNRAVVSKFFEGQYMLRFVGADALSPQAEQEMDIKALGSYETLNEVRRRRNLPDLPDGDVPLNSQYLQIQQQKMQQEMFSSQGVVETQDGGGNQPENMEKAQETNPFTEALENYFQKLK